MSQVSPTIPLPLSPESLPMPPDQPYPLTPRSIPVELGACGLPLKPLDADTLRDWETETGTTTDVGPVVGRAGQAELSGFEEDEDLGGGEAPPDEDADDEFDDFDDIDEDDFDDDFDDDFEEELDDDYEIEIEDEISAEFGLSGVVDIDVEDVDDVDAIDDDIEIDPGDVDEKE